MNYERKKIIVKETYTDKDGKENHKWHEAGILMIDEKGSMFGSLNVFGNKIKFSVFDYEKKQENKDEIISIKGIMEKHKEELKKDIDIPF